MLEGALVFLGVTALLLGIIDWSRAMLAYNFVAYSARDAARYATVHGSTSGSAASATDLANRVNTNAVGLESGLVTVTTTWSPDNTPGSTVAVQVQYAFSAIAPYVPSMTIKSKSKMLILQ